MNTSSTQIVAATTEQLAATPAVERKGGFIPGAVAAQGCCGSSGSSSGCCGEAAAATTATAATAVQKPAIAPIALQSGCCGSSTSSCCS
jgi:hypothetical protein